MAFIDPPTIGIGLGASQYPDYSAKAADEARCKMAEALFQGGRQSASIGAPPVEPTISRVEVALRAATGLATRVEAMQVKMFGPEPCATGSVVLAQKSDGVIQALLAQAGDTSDDIARAHAALDRIERVLGIS